MLDEYFATYDTSTLSRLLRFVQHGPSCDWLDVMWHKGPCNCGLFKLLDEIREASGGTLPPELEAIGRGPYTETDPGFGRKGG